MLDRLLGRAGLRERVADLEAEKASLEAQLAAAEERRAEAETARQEVAERANRLEDRVAELEDRVERAGGQDTGPQVRGRERLGGRRRDEVLDRLESVKTGPEGALTAMVPDGSDVPDGVRDVLGERAALVSRAAPAVVCADDAGLVAVALRPAVAPDAFVTRAEGFALERSWFAPTGSHALALVRSDLFALGEYDGEERVATSGFTTRVKSDHSKGGFSQGRFERLREGQIADHVDRCREAILEADAERVFVVGERSLLHEFADLADVTAAVDATGDPEDALDHAVADFWATRLTLL